MKNNFIKQNFLTSGILAIGVPLLCFIKNCVRNTPQEFLSYAAMGACIFGICALVWTSLLFLQELGIVSVGGQDDENDDVSVAHYYSSYINGICLVHVVTKRKKTVEAKYTFVNESGEFITDELFFGASDFSNGFSARVVREDGKFNLIGKDGTLLCAEWYVNIGDFFDGKAKVFREDGTINFISADGTLCWKEWKSENLEY